MMKTILGDHLVSLLGFSVLAAVFFAFLYHDDAPAIRKSFRKTFLWMVAGSLAAAWLMLLLD